MGLTIALDTASMMVRIDMLSVEAEDLRAGAGVDVPFLAAVVVTLEALVVVLARNALLALGATLPFTEGS